MNMFSFVWPEPTSLAVELRKPLRSVSVEFDPNGWPRFVSLWRHDGTGLRLSSEMHDVAERKEVGVLKFEYVSSPKDSEISENISAAFNDGITPFKLVIHESGTNAESGVVLKGSDGNEIIVVAGAFPYFLAVRGVFPVGGRTFNPEYPLDLYSRIPVV